MIPDFGNNCDETDTFPLLINVFIIIKGILAISVHKYCQLFIYKSQGKYD